MTDERPMLIGLTGNIATGKSSAAHVLAELGAETIDADQVAHAAIRAGTAAHAAIAETFGPDVLAGDGEINRRRLGAIVFSDPAALARLEAIVHPATLALIDTRIAASTARVVVIEAIKLIESGITDRCDSLWVTTCPREQQIGRLMRGRDMSRAEAEQRVDAQPPQREKIARADVVINTTGPLAETRTQLVAAWERLAGHRTCT